MNKLRTVISLFFVVAMAVCGVYTIKVKMTEDYNPPVITCEEDVISVSVMDEESALLRGIKAEDNEDGDLTDSVRISSMSHFISDNKRTITYVVFDSANQVGTLERTIQYTDYTSPKIYLNEPLRYSVAEMAQTSYLESVTAEDCLDGDLSKQVRTIFDNSYYNETAGVYPMTLQVSNSAGDLQSISIEVVVIDNADSTERVKYYPLLSDYIIYTNINQELDLNQYIIGLEQNDEAYLYDGNPEFQERVEGRIQISSEVNYKEAGVYEVEYTYTSDAGITATTKAYVIVEGVHDGEQ